jgi:hypothetical protein
LQVGEFIQTEKLIKSRAPTAGKGSQRGCHKLGVLNKVIAHNILVDVVEFRIVHK